MALQVKLVQKVGQISMSAGVTTALQEGWQLYGPPFVSATNAVQVMFLPDDFTPNPDAQYYMVSKYGLVTVAEQLIAHIEDGWKLYEDAIETQYGPTHAMTKGDPKVYQASDSGTGTGGDGLTQAQVQALIDSAIAGLPAPQDWQEAIDAGDQATLQQAGETAINAVNDLRETMEHKDQVVLDGAKAYTDDAILALPGNPDWQTNIDTGDQETLAAAQTYVDDQIANIPPQPEYDWQLNINQGDGETLNAARSYTDSKATDTLQIAAGHADEGDIYTMDAAKAYTDEKIAALPVPKDWEAAITEGDAAALSSAVERVEELKLYAESLVEKGNLATLETAAIESTKLLNETMEAVVAGAETRWEAADKNVLDVAQVANNKGTLVTPNMFNAGPVAIAANAPGEGRTTIPLPLSDSVPDGFTQQVLNVNGVADSTAWAAALRVHCAVADYEKGYTVQTSRSLNSNSFVLDEGGFATVVLDKTNKKWFYVGVHTKPNDSKGPTNGRMPDSDLPEG